jgi:hypothetical protein
VVAAPALAALQNGVDGLLLSQYGDAVTPSPIDAIAPAFEQMKRMLFMPFRFGQWLRFAVVGFLAGEMGQAGGCQGNIPFEIPSSNSDQFQLLQLPIGRGPSLVAAIAIVAALVLGLVIGILLLYVSSRMRFVLFDSMLAGECRIRRFWAQRGDPAWRYFVWQLGLALVSILTLLILVAPPVVLAALMGWFQNPRDHLLGLIVGGGLLVLLFLAVVFTIVLIQVMTKDFVVPQMALEGLTAVDGWRRLRSLLRSEPWDYVGYLGLKIVLAIAAAIVLGIISLVVLLLLLLPVGGFGAIAILGGRAAGLSWNPLTVLLMVVVGAILLLGILFVVSLISVPAIVFFPAYSIRFFASRYAPLQAAMNRGNTPGTAPASS